MNWKLIVSGLVVLLAATQVVTSGIAYSDNKDNTSVIITFVLSFVFLIFSGVVTYMVFKSGSAGDAATMAQATISSALGSMF
jgi:heme/copper-type cytochrome/quinol oxidase subunit 2